MWAGALPSPEPAYWSAYLERDAPDERGWGQETLGSLQGQRQAGLGPQSEIFTWDGIWTPKQRRVWPLREQILADAGPQEGPAHRLPER